MSSPFSQPNKPLEHLKVTRLEEAIRKEVEVAGISLGEPVFSGDIQQHETVKADVLTSTHEVKLDAPIDVRPHLDTHCNAKMDAHVDTHWDVRVDCRQMAVEQEKLKSDCSRMQKYEDEHIRPEGRAGELSKEVDLKSADAESHDDACPKRKYNEREMKHQEPAKRMRRWNSGNCLVGEVSEPLTTETVKEIMFVEVKEIMSVEVKVLASSRSSTQSVVRAKHVANRQNNKKPQSVPAPLHPPTTALKIERFIRPFTIKSVKDLLAAYGHCVDFWMDQIKTHCYVSYSAVDEAIAARNALYGRRWPPPFGNRLVAEFVDALEVEIRCEGLPEMENVTPVTIPGWRSSITPSQTAAVHTSTAPLPPPPPSRERQALLPLKRESVPPILTLDDLFKKTKVKPHIYYLPLTDEQVAAKLGVTTEKSQSRFSAPVRSLNA